MTHDPLPTMVDHAPRTTHNKNQPNEMAQYREFYRHWSMKEAYVKAHGELVLTMLVLTMLVLTMLFLTILFLTMLVLTMLPLAQSSPNPEPHRAGAGAQTGFHRFRVQ